MKYHYYPGCSLEASAMEYDLSTRAVLQALDVELIDIPGWTCCGASAAEATSELLSLSLAARNLALAAKAADRLDILIPCSACYLNLKRVEQKTRGDARLKERLNTVLEAEGLELDTMPPARHLLDVLSRDIGAAPIRENLKRRLDGLRVAPYYGCQCLRPYAVFDDPEAPRSMEALIQATGAVVHRFAMAARCCGASHMNTKREVGLALVSAILKDARGADAVVTVCPMCQMNLEAYQRKASRLAGEDLTIPVLYLPQLLGLALGLPPEQVRLDLNLAMTEAFAAMVAA
jgi:heterodisulfide reductase subunit B